MKKLFVLGLLALVSFLAAPAVTLLAGGQPSGIVADGGNDHDPSGG